MNLKIILTAAIFIVVLLSSCSKSAEQTLSEVELLDLGEKYLLEMNYEQAIVYFTKTIEVYPMNPRAYTGLAEAYAGIGEIEKAIEILQQGLGVLPDNADILSFLSELESSDEQPPKASPTPIPTETPSFGVDSGEFTTTATLIDNSIEYAEQYEQYQAEAEAELGNDADAVFILMYGFGLRFDPPLRGIDDELVDEAGSAIYDELAQEDDLIKLYELFAEDNYNGLKVLVTGTLAYNEEFSEISMNSSPNDEYDGPHIYTGKYSPNGPYQFKPVRIEAIGSTATSAPKSINSDDIRSEVMNPTETTSP